MLSSLAARSVTLVAAGAVRFQFEPSASPRAPARHSPPASRPAASGSSGEGSLPGHDARSVERKSPSNHRFYLAVRRARRARRRQRRGDRRRPAGHDPAVENRPGGPRRDGRHRPRRVLLPGQGAADMARRRRHHPRGRCSGPSARAARRAPSASPTKSVCDLVKAYAGRIGLDADAFGAHSLRSGFLPSVARCFNLQDAGREPAQVVGRIATVRQGR
jgi:hypothetical protein